jgi:hypothetical protein
MKAKPSKARGGRGGKKTAAKPVKDVELEVAEQRKRRKLRKQAAKVANALNILPRVANVGFPEGFRVRLSEESLEALSSQPEAKGPKKRRSQQEAKEIRHIKDRPDFPSKAPEVVQYFSEKASGQFTRPNDGVLSRETQWIYLFIQRLSSFTRCLGDVLHEGLPPKNWRPHAEAALQKQILPSWSGEYTEELMAIEALRDCALMAAVTLRLASERGDGGERSGFIAEKAAAAFQDLESFFVLPAEQARKRKERRSKRADDPRDWSHAFTAQCVKLMSDALYLHAVAVGKGACLKVEGYSSALPSVEFNAAAGAFEAWSLWFMGWLDTCSRRGIIDRDMWIKRRTTLIAREIIPEIHRRWMAGLL